MKRKKKKKNPQEFTMINSTVWETELLL